MMSFAQPTFTDEREVAIDGVPLTVLDNVEYTMLNIFGKRVSQGPPGPNDHPVNSTWITENAIGGGQKKEGLPGVDQDRFWWSTCWTDTPEIITLPPKTTIIARPVGATGNAVVIGDYRDDFYVAWGQNIYNYNATLGFRHTFGNFTNLGATPVQEGKVFTNSSGNTALFIPCGASLKRFDGAMVSDAGVESISVEVWDNFVLSLGPTGRIMKSSDGLTWADMGTTPMYTPDGFDPTRLITYRDLNGRYVIWVITNGAAYVLDFESNLLHKADLRFPKHPDQGRAADVWRGDLYVSVGTGIHKTDGTQVSAAGPDRNDGLPDEFNGTVVDFSSEYNVLYTLIAGAQSTLPFPSTSSDLLSGEFAEEHFEGSEPVANSVLMAWNGNGWHYRYHELAGVPKNVVVANNPEEIYRVWFAIDDRIYYQNLSTIYFNPETSPGGDFAETSYHITSWHDWGWKGQRKVLKQFEIFTKGCSDQETIQIEYQIDDELNPWVNLGIVTTNGQHQTKLGYIDGYALGIKHERVRLKFTLTRRSDDSTKRPTIKWFDVIGRQVMRPQRQWRFKVDIQRPTKDFTESFLVQRMEEWVNQPQGHLFTYHGRVYTVDIVSINGPDFAGDRWGGRRAMSLIESFETFDEEEVGQINP